jgi:Flp pilus assembly pilin Flp
MRIREFIEGEEGIGTVEMVLILVVIVAIVIIFKDKITEFVNKQFETINTKSETLAK